MSKNNKICSALNTQCGYLSSCCFPSPPTVIKISLTSSKSRTKTFSNKASVFCDLVPSRLGCRCARVPAGCLTYQTEAPPLLFASQDNVHSSTPGCFNPTPGTIFWLGIDPWLTAGLRGRTVWKSPVGHSVADRWQQLDDGEIQLVDVEEEVRPRFRRVFKVVTEKDCVHHHVGRSRTNWCRFLSVGFSPQGGWWVMYVVQHWNPLHSAPSHHGPLPSDTTMAIREQEKKEKVRLDLRAVWTLTDVLATCFCLSSVGYIIK